MTKPTTPPPAPPAQTTLKRRAEEYLAMRRSLGFKLTTWGTKPMSFVGYLEPLGHTVITTEDAVAWATSTPRRSRDPVHWARRLDVVRIFARHMKTLDPATQIPPEDVISRRYRRITPYLYSPTEIVALLLAASRLSPPLRAATWQTALGLLAVTGMRGQRGMPARPLGCGPAPRCAHRAGLQVRQVARHTRPPLHHRGAGRLRTRA